jgi:type II secretory pathway component PulC
MAPVGAPIGAPRLRVSMVLYSAIPARRRVALTIDGGSLTTLHEGEEASGIEVLQIQPDRVELRWQGQAFTLEVRS